MKGGWPGLHIVRTLEGAPSKLRLGGGVPRLTKHPPKKSFYPNKTGPIRPDRP